jgi:hypothetical protein
MCPRRRHTLLHISERHDWLAKAFAALSVYEDVIAAPLLQPHACPALQQLHDMQHCNMAVLPIGPVCTSLHPEVCVPSYWDCKATTGCSTAQSLINGSQAGDGT